MSLWRFVPVSPDLPAGENEVVSGIQAGGFSAGYLKGNSSAGTAPAVLQFFSSAGSLSHAPTYRFFFVCRSSFWMAGRVFPPVSSAGYRLQTSIPLQSSVPVSSPGPALRTERDVFPKLDGIPFLFQIMKNCFFRPCLCDRLIHVLPDDTRGRWACLPALPPFSILLRHSPDEDVSITNSPVLPARRSKQSAYHGKIPGLGPVIPFPVCIGNRIDHKVVVKMMGLIQMSGNQPPENALPTAPAPDGHRSHVPLRGTFSGAKD